MSKHSKIDAADAYVLGAIPLFGGVPAAPVYVPTADSHALQRLTRQRERLEEEASTIKRRLIDLARWASPAIVAILPDFRTNLALAILHDLFDPAIVTTTRRTPLLAFIAKSASSKHPHSGLFAEKLVDGLKAAAVEPQHLHAVAVNFQHLQLEVVIEIERMRLLEASSASLAARSRHSTMRFIRPMRCAASRGLAMAWHLSY